MTKRRKWLATAWAVTAVLVTSWVVAQTDDVSPGNALMVGVFAATVLTAVVASLKRGG